MNKLFTLSEAQCINEGHESNPVIGLCIDPSCTILNKLLCLECVFSLHSQHKIVKLKQIEDKIIEEMKSQSESKVKQDEIQSKVKSVEEKITNSIEMLKTDILEIFSIKLNNFLQCFQISIKELTKVNKKFYNEPIQLKSIKDYEALSEAITMYHNDTLGMAMTMGKLGMNNNNNDNQPFSLIPVPPAFSARNSIPSLSSLSSVSNKEKIKDAMEELHKFEYNYDKFIKEEKQTICEFFLKTFLEVNPSSLFLNILSFEWSETKYGSFGFVYQISNNKLTATKTLSEGTITIVRAKEQLSLDQDYYIEYVVDYKKGGDFDIGFGKDSVGMSCWTRTGGAYGLTNIGMYENGKLSKKDLKVADGDVIGFELYLKSNRQCKLMINGALVHEFKIEIEEIYPMCAIRRIENAVTVKQFKVIS